MLRVQGFTHLKKSGQSGHSTPTRSVLLQEGFVLQDTLLETFDRIKNNVKHCSSFNGNAEIQAYGDTLNAMAGGSR